jgi:hypothetical protein
MLACWPGPLGSRQGSATSQIDQAHPWAPMDHLAVNVISLYKIRAVACLLAPSRPGQVLGTESGGGHPTGWHGVKSLAS